MLDSLITYFFWTSLFVVVYSIIGYPIVLYALVLIKRTFGTSKTLTLDKIEFTEKVAVVIPCYNESDIIEEKVYNTLSLDYPKELLKIYVVADGSTDNTSKVIQNLQNNGIDIHYFYDKKRAGKSAAINRVINKVKEEITVCTDANTLLNRMAIKEIIKNFKDKKVGCVCGEKRVLQEAGDVASSGEGAYWKYESFLKKLDAELTSVMGGAGELIAFRTNVYPQIPKKIILDDFYLSMKILLQGYKVAYEPKAFASEKASVSVREEMKRKIRIAAGGFQIIFTLLPLFNIFKRGMVTFQYVSHRVLRWLFVPFALPLIYIANFYLMVFVNPLYSLLFLGQTLMYTIAFIIHSIKRKTKPYKVFMLPYYYAIMNYCALLGFFRYLSGTQSSVWDKAIRK
ncbi:glycosyltransferase family 2 protein [Flammeovirga sp. SubArs3]|uniref:glycosyltransferase family 2 protein n=1 Tax=Flammeovirga sp. SubArs3 TaxID=2995316 RepID=UPI00248C3099|nr:glycosyltransferase family 2 protein [Flammeovirga sp. SubArs3]